MVEGAAGILTAFFRDLANEHAAAMVEGAAGILTAFFRDLANEHAAAMVEGAAGMVLQGAKEGKHAAKLKVQ